MWMWCNSEFAHLAPSAHEHVKADGEEELNADGDREGDVECVHAHRVRDEVDAERRGSVRDHRVARARRPPLDKVEV